ncbi:DUF202 domain-containing protein [Natronococcus sp.]|uniref:DUF7534 family protein n=1 Tax=Natronococcus sp. TaxID=35747 RepID=UPI003A4E0D97
MHSRTFSKFLSTSLLLAMGAVTVAAIVSPPDPFTLVLYSMALLVLASATAYAITYGMEIGSCGEKA